MFLIIGRHKNHKSPNSVPSEDSSVHVIIMHSTNTVLPTTKLQDLELHSTPVQHKPAPPEHKRKSYYTWHSSQNHQKNKRAIMPKAKYDTNIVQINPQASQVSSQNLPNSNHPPQISNKTMNKH